MKTICSKIGSKHHTRLKSSDWMESESKC